MGELIPWGIWILSRHCHSSPRYEENHEVLPASVGCPGVCGTRGPCWLHSDGALLHCQAPSWVLYTCASTESHNHSRGAVHLHITDKDARLKGAK